MAKKRTKVCVNAVDKYLKQMKYRAAFKTTEKPKIGQPRIVIPRIKSKRLQELIDISKLEKNLNKALNIKVSVVRLKRAPVGSKVTPTLCDPYSRNNTAKRKVDQPKEDIPRKTNETKSVGKGFSKSTEKIKTTQPINETKKAIISNHSKIIKKKKVKVSKVSEKKLIIKSLHVEVNQKNKKNKSTKALPSSCIVSLGEKSIEKSAQSSGLKKVSKRKFPNPLHDAAFLLKRKKNHLTDIKEGNDLCNVEETLTDGRISFAEFENLDVSSTREQPVTSHCQTNSAASREAENQNEVFESEESSPPSSSFNEPCLCEPLNFDMDDFSRPNVEKRESLIPAKYRPCVEELKSLTSEIIDKFIKDNQQYYIDFKFTEPKRKMSVNAKKKRLDELKDAFKCNPFDSAQQVAMYLALREIFNIPSGSFLECRYFFTLLIPEVCSQLFSKIFHVKSSSAPRLIKKLYPQPVSPV